MLLNWGYRRVVSLTVVAKTGPAVCQITCRVDQIQIAQQLQIPAIGHDVPDGKRVISCQLLLHLRVRIPGVLILEMRRERVNTLRGEARRGMLCGLFGKDGWQAVGVAVPAMLAM